MGWQDKIIQQINNLQQEKEDFDKEVTQSWKPEVKFEYKQEPVENKLYRSWYEKKIEEMQKQAERDTLNKSLWKTTDHSISSQNTSQFFPDSNESIGETILNNTINAANEIKDPEERKTFLVDRSKNTLENTAVSLALGSMFGLYGNLAKIGSQVIATPIWMYQSARTLQSPEGVSKTANLARQANQEGWIKSDKTLAAAKSLAGDVFDASIIGIPTTKIAGVIDKVLPALKQYRTIKAGNMWKNMRIPTQIEYMPAEWQSQPEGMLSYPITQKAYVRPQVTTKSLFGDNSIMSDWSGLENPEVTKWHFGFEGKPKSIIEFGPVKGTTVESVITKPTVIKTTTVKPRFSKAMKQSFKERTGFDIESAPKVMQDRELIEWNKYVDRLRKGHKNK